MSSTRAIRRIEVYPAPRRRSSSTSSTPPARSAPICCPPATCGSASRSAGFGPVDVTCIDNGQPLVIVDAAALEPHGLGVVAELNADDELKDARRGASAWTCGETHGARRRERRRTTRR